MLCIDLNAGKTAFFGLPETSFVGFTAMLKIWPLLPTIPRSVLNKVEKLPSFFQSLLGKIRAPYKSVPVRISPPKTSYTRGDALRTEGCCTISDISGVMLKAFNLPNHG